METEEIKTATARGESGEQSEALNPVLSDESLESSILAMLETEPSLKTASPEAGKEAEEPTAEEVEEKPADEPEADEQSDAEEKAEQDQEKDKGEEAEEENSFDVTPEVQAKIDKAMHRKHARMKAAEDAAKSEKQLRETAESKIAELENELATASQQQRPTVGTAENPLSGVTNARDLQARAAEAENAIEQIDDLLIRLKRNPDVVEAALKNSKIQLAEYTPDAMEEFLTVARRNADKTLRVHVPKQQKFIAEETKASKEAEEELPVVWRDPKTAGYKWAQEILKEYPEIKRYPQWKKITNLIVLGRVKQMEVAEFKNGKAKTAAPAKVPPKVSGARTKAAPQIDPEKAKISNTLKKFKETGSAKDLENAIAAGL